MKKCIYIWVNTDNPYNSIFLHSKLLSEKLKEIYDIDILFINRKTKNLQTYLESITKEDIVLFEYGGFTLDYLLLKNANPIFIYHNITPAHFFITTEPLVAIRALIGRLQLRLFNKKRRFIAVSQYNEAELINYGFKYVSYCPNIIEPAIKPFIEKTKEISLIYVGRIVQNKNCLSLLNQVRELAEITKQPILFFLIGSAKPNTFYEKLFTAKLRKLNSHPFVKIEWIKSIDDKLLKKYYQKSWLYISTSLHEGFGLPACESILNRTPALYFECGGQESVLKGLGMVQKKKSSIFRNKLVSLLKDKNEYNDLLEKQYTEVISNFVSPSIDYHIKNTFNKIILNNKCKMSSRL